MIILYMNNKLNTILYNENEEIQIIIMNIVKMLYNRGWLKLDENKIDKYVENIIKTENNMEYTIKDKEIYIIKFYLQKITSIKKTDLEEFLTENKKNHKILIITEINTRTKKDILEFGKIEIFVKEELMINIIDNILVPKHYLLNDNEKRRFIDEYLVKNKELPRIYIYDPIARYYYAKIGDIFRIERYSLTSGISIIYRIVVAI
jgi:DNA-directed RNA polymerase subunit H (RpoH/RPB5)